MKAEPAIGTPDVVAWHALPVETVLAQVATDGHSGLTARAAEERLAQYGPNRLTAKQGKSPLLRFLLQFHNPLIYILLTEVRSLSYSKTQLMLPLSWVW